MPHIQTKPKKTMKIITCNKWLEYRYELDLELFEHLIECVEDTESVTETYLTLLSNFFTSFYNDELGHLEDNRIILIQVYKQTVFHPIKIIIPPLGINKLALSHVESQVRTQLENQLSSSSRDELATKFIIVYKIVSDYTTNDIPTKFPLPYLSIIVNPE